MAIYNTFGAPFIRSLLPPETKILHQIISFRVNTIYIENHYELYSRIFAYVSSMIEDIGFTVAYTHFSGIIISLCIIISIGSAGVLTIFFYICNAFQNNILPYPEERVYLGLPNLHLEWFKIKFLRISLASINTKEFFI